MSEGTYFEKPPVDLAPDDILCFVAMRNEALRLPYFLEFYRAAGVKHFFIVDNGSTDESPEILAAASDVTAFSTTGSYKGSAAGRQWTEELADHYGDGHWCLTLDVDELFVYPYAEHASLSEFCDALDREGAEAVLCVFLDMYSDKPLSQTVATPGQPFLEVCPYYEIDSYTLKAGAYPPFLAINGGPRWRQFWEESEERSGPMMKKSPLLKWRKGLGYNYSTHSHNHVQMSATTAALLHFKFFSAFIELSSAEAARGDRRQGQDYAAYADKMEADDLLLFGPTSRLYSDSTDLVRDGIVAVGDDWRDRVIERGGEAAATSVRRSAVRPPSQSVLNPFDNQLGLGALSAVWPIVNNTAQQALLAGVVTDRARSESALAAVAAEIELADIYRDMLYVEINPQTWNYIGIKPGLNISLNGVPVKTFSIDRDSCRSRTVVDSLRPSLFTFPLPSGDDLDLVNLLTAGPGMQRLDLYVIDLTDGDGSDVQQPRVTVTQGRGAMFDLSSRIIDWRTDRTGFEGVLERIGDGDAMGWISRTYPDGRLSWKHHVTLYLNGWYVGEATPYRKRGDLERTVVITRNGIPETTEVEGLGFRFTLPLAFFRDAGHTDFHLEANATRRNLLLRRTPATFTGHAARWNHEERRWGT